MLVIDPPAPPMPRAPGRPMFMPMRQEACRGTQGRRDAAASEAAEDPGGAREIAFLRFDRCFDRRTDRLAAPVARRDDGEGSLPLWRNRQAGCGHAPVRPLQPPPLARGADSGRSALLSALPFRGD
jgi:hypothetical protein